VTVSRESLERYLLPPPSSCTILDQNIEALLNRKRGVEDDQSETEGKYIVAPAHFQKVADRFL
jgi:hypothetical protein